MTRVRRLDLKDHALGFALMVSYVALLLATAGDLAMSRDESFYVDAADQYGRWMVLFADNPTLASEQVNVDRYWATNHEHPSFVKGMFAIFHLADERFELFDQPTTGYRFFGMLSAGLLLWLIYVFAARAYGRQVGVFAALAFALLPRVFYHAHLDCFDVPIVLMLTWVTYCYWRSLASPRWAWMTGLAYGIALATKHNAWTLPGILLVHWLFVVATEIRSRYFLKRQPTTSFFPHWLLAMAVIGPVVFVALWPWLWFDTANRFSDYAGFHIHHEYYNMAYFGVNYFRPPFPISYPWVMTLFTVPLVTIALASSALLVRLRALLPPGLMERMWPEGSVSPDSARTDVLLFGSLLAPLVIITLPWTPIFGGTKHWFPGYPFLAMFAGMAFVSVARAVRRLIPRGWPGAKYVARLGTALVLLLPAAIETVHSHPFGLSHYTFAAGGVPGAADHGMNRQFWGFTTGSLVGWFTEQMPDGGNVYVCDTTGSAWRMLQEDGRLPMNIRASGSLVGADYALVHHEHHFVEVDYQLWAAWQSVAPVYVLTYDGVPIISVYENPDHRARAERTQSIRRGPVR